MDDGSSALHPHKGLATIAEDSRRFGRDYARPFSWVYPWLLALTGIAITLLLAG